jgi:CDP-4-dehydro-6-deoxyglucose reductase
VNYIRDNKTIKLTGPFGQLRYHTDPKYPLIFIATGTGFAPCKAIIEQALQDKQGERIELYWGARESKDLYFNKELLQLSESNNHFSYFPVLESRVYHAVLARHQDLSHFHLYLSGHQEMVFTAQKLFQFPQYFYSDWLDYKPNEN